MKSFTAGRFALAAAAAITFGGSKSVAAPSAANCTERVQTNVHQLLACIRLPALWAHMTAFQRIANRNPGPDGHGNRDTGQPGYKASVDYVAGLVRQAGYHVTVQSYNYKEFTLTAPPVFTTGGRHYESEQDWFVARLSATGRLTAPVQPVGGISGAANGGAATGCSATDFAGFVPGNIALMQRGACDFDIAITHARAAGAAAAIFYNSRDSLAQGGKGSGGRAYQAMLDAPAPMPVVGVASYAVGAEFVRQYVAGHAPTAHLDIQTHLIPNAIDYNLIADSPFGDANHVVVAEGHLDAIYGAGMLDNASGSATLLEVALNMAKTPTRNQLRYIWFGGEELGLLGSKYYTRTLPRNELRRIVYDIDADVTATPNFNILIAAAQNANDVKRFPPNVVPGSRIGNKYFEDYFSTTGLAVRLAGFGNSGTDSNSFSLHGVPNTGILTQQDCCKTAEDVKIWGGFRGNYEGKVPGFNGGCVDRRHRWCDNLSNNDPFVLEFVSKAVAYVTYKLANDPSL